MPQGSVLEPILFLIFVNDPPLFISEAYLEMFADDATVHSADKELKAVENKLQISAIDFMSQCMSNKIYANMGKSFVMTSGSHHNLSHTDAMKIYINNELIIDVESQTSFRSNHRSNFILG